MRRLLHDEALNQIQRRLVEMLLSRGRTMPLYVQKSLTIAVSRLTNGDMYELVQIYKRYADAEGEE